MQFAEGTGTGTYKLGVAPSPTNQYFVDPNVPNTTLSKSSGAFPQRTFVQGNYIPGIVIGATGRTVNSFRCALSSSTSGNDIGQITVTLQAEAGWTGNAVVTLQGGYNRYSNATTNWVAIGSTTATITTALQSVNLQVSSDQMWPVYRLQAVSSDGIGTIDWSIGNMFPDLSAELVGGNATKVNGSLGQEALQVNSSIPFGRETSWVGSSSSNYTIASTSTASTTQTYVTNSSATSQPFAIGQIVTVNCGTANAYNVNGALITAVGGSQGSWSFGVAGSASNATNTGTAIVTTTGVNKSEIGAMFTPGGMM